MVTPMSPRGFCGWFSSTKDKADPNARRIASGGRLTLRRNTRQRDARGLYRLEYKSREGPEGARAPLTMIGCLKNQCERLMRLWSQRMLYPRR